MDGSNYNDELILYEYGTQSVKDYEEWFTTWGEWLKINKDK